MAIDWNGDVGGSKSTYWQRKNPQKREKRGREKRERKDGFNGSA